MIFRDRAGIEAILNNAGFTSGNFNERQKAFLVDAGFTGQLNEAWYRYFRSNGFTGHITEMANQFLENGVGPSAEFANTLLLIGGDETPSGAAPIDESQYAATINLVGSANNGCYYDPPTFGQIEDGGWWYTGDFANGSGGWIDASGDEWTIPPGGAFTIEHFSRTPVDPDQWRMWLHMDNGTDPAFYWGYHDNSWGHWNSNVGYAQPRWAGTGYGPGGNLRHTAFVYDGTKVSWYSDGIRRGQLPVANLTLPQTTTNRRVWLGRREVNIGAPSYAMAHAGQFDEFRFSLGAVYTDATLTIPTVKLPRS